MPKANLKAEYRTVKTMTGTQKVPVTGSLTVIHQGRNLRYSADGAPYDVPDEIYKRHKDRFEVAKDAPPARKQIGDFPESFDRFAETLAKAGITTLAQVRAATDEQLLAIEGIGPGYLKFIRAEQGTAETE